ncbi:hypothetical protein [Xenorhabdus szentirmaii]|uniref:Glycoside hydrolase family 42 N-terminal domain-containing protein n=2 Tax=Xenorhabdus szentirmaii TaxID=290112 RepID=W1J2A1_9GAMM|nr:MULTISPECIES: hypothetical protein [Xenorhabdus]MBD2780657.1 hypothetical protein [Xenorhabdus sp. 38]MBD2791395.1 hypothetical protein [Xenorhabdus sp. CUL]MBD2799562.1 hypothetical protein [Xenorhabdus sp. M]MBD2803164.1 hypothetical protein [Xenorhabdus sp. ZM]MBD2821733.1 hypothetical protein [Xenorhabdus sp. 42]
MRIITIFLIFCFYGGNSLAVTPQNYLYTSSGELEELGPLLARADINGVQIIYTWKQLEKSQGEYDFSAIKKDLSVLNKMNKKLFIQIQDRFFEPTHRNIPLYLLQEPQYRGGLIAQSDNPGEGKSPAQGWAAAQWNEALRERYQHLLSALATELDGKITGINLPETAIDIDLKKENAGFTCDKYFSATIDNILFARKVFKKSYVVQYVNFWPCEWNNDHNYMSRLFEIAQKNNIGLGGPDIVPYKKGQMKNSYPFFHQYKNKLALVAMAIQEPTLTYTNPQTKKKFTQQEFIKFAEEYLGVNIIFWSTHSPWLNQ